MKSGFIKFFSTAKKFGFITGDDGKDYYFHAKDLLNTVMNGTKVWFDVEETKRGVVAVRITIHQPG